MNEHARQQLFLRIRELGAYGDRARAFVHGHFGDFQRTVMRIFGAVRQDQPGLGRAVPGLLQPAAFQVAPQRNQVLYRLGHVDIDRIELLDGRQLLRLAIADQRPFRHRGAAYTPGDGRKYFGIANIDFRPFQLGLGLQRRSPSLIMGLLAHRLFLDQQRIAIRQRLGRRQPRLSTFQGGLVYGRIDLIELLTLLYFTPFCEQALLNDAADLRPDLGNAEGCGSPRQLRCQFERLSSECHDANLRGRLPRRRRRLFVLTTAEQCYGDEKWNQNSTGWFDQHRE